jgi:hypothetical protein
LRGRSERTLRGDHECGILCGVGVHCRLLVADGRISVEWCLEESSLFDSQKLLSGSVSGPI